MSLPNLIEGWIFPLFLEEGRLETCKLKQTLYDQTYTPQPMTGFQNAQRKKIRESILINGFPLE